MIVVVMTRIGCRRKLRRDDDETTGRAARRGSISPRQSSASALCEEPPTHTTEATCNSDTQPATSQLNHGSSSARCSGGLMLMRRLVLALALLQSCERSKSSVSQPASPAKEEEQEQLNQVCLRRDLTCVGVHASTRRQRDTTSTVRCPCFFTRSALAKAGLPSLLLGLPAIRRDQQRQRPVLEDDVVTTGPSERYTELEPHTQGATYETCWLL